MQMPILAPPVLRTSARVAPLPSSGSLGPSQKVVCAVGSHLCTLNDDEWCCEDGKACSTSAPFGCGQGGMRP